MFNDHSDKIRAIIKMPFLPAVFKQPNQSLVGTISYENPANEKDVIELTICHQAVHFNSDEISKSFNNGNTLEIEAL